MTGKQYMTFAELQAVMNDLSPQGLVALIYQRIQHVTSLGVGQLPDGTPGLHAALDDEGDPATEDIQEFEMGGKWVKVSVQHGCGPIMLQ